MKLFVKAACMAFVLTVLYSLIPFQAQCSEISDEVFRIHIVANSDSDADQALKLKVRDDVLEYSRKLIENAGSLEEAENAAVENLDGIRETALERVHAEGFDYDVEVEITNMYFSTRYYENYTLPAGMYDAVRVTIGKGEGRNWWCVIYPNICLSAASDADDNAKRTFDDGQYDIVKNESLEYKFKIVEIFEWICSLFGG